MESIRHRERGDRQRGRSGRDGYRGPRRDSRSPRRRPPPPPREVDTYIPGRDRGGGRRDFHDRPAEKSTEHGLRGGPLSISVASRVNNAARSKICRKL